MGGNFQPRNNGVAFAQTAISHNQHPGVNKLIGVQPQHGYAAMDGIFQLGQAASSGLPLMASTAIFNPLPMLPPNMLINPPVLILRRNNSGSLKMNEPVVGMEPQRIVAGVDPIIIGTPPTIVARLMDQHHHRQQAFHQTTIPSSAGEINGFVPTTTMTSTAAAPLSSSTASSSVAPATRQGTNGALSTATTDASTYFWINNVSPNILSKRLQSPPRLGRPSTKERAIDLPPPPPLPTATTKRMRLDDAARIEEPEDMTIRSSQQHHQQTPPGNEQPALTERQARFGLGGQKRLVIAFSSFGKLSKDSPPEHFGKNDLVIPDGLCGTHTMYSQEWRFEIEHHHASDDGGGVVITWRITNLSTGNQVSMTESPEQAQLRRLKGKTICNIVVKRALEQRAVELEQVLDRLKASESSNALQCANLETMIRKLRPKQCTEGLLFFGLRHDCVQNRFKNVLSTAGGESLSA